MTRRYTDAEKADALERYVEHGPSEAARQTGIPKGTVGRWAREAGLDGTLRAQKTQAATDARHRDWVLQRLEEANAAGETAAKAREAIVKALEAGEIKGRDLATVYGVLIDKAQLLSGEATEAHDHRLSTSAIIERADDNVESIFSRRTS